MRFCERLTARSSLGEREGKRFKVAMPSEIEIEGVRGRQELKRECDVEGERERFKRGDRPQVYGCCSVDQVSSHRNYRELLGYNLC